MEGSRRVIEELRAEMSQVDAELVKLLDRRARLSKKIGAARKDAPNAPIAERGAMIELAATSSGDMPESSLREILGRVHAECLALEVPVPVVYAGPEGGRGDAAARSRFGHSSTYVHAEDATLAFEEVTQKRAQFAVVPLETRTDGPVQATILALMASDLRIVSCFEVAENLDLVSRSGTVVGLEKIYAMPGDHAATAKFLTEIGSGARVLDVRSPSAGAERAREDATAAAVISRGMAEQYQLAVVKSGVRDGGDERVRYAIVGARPSARTGNDLTALALSVADSPGALHEVLKQFAERGINLTKIQSRPAAGEAWAYLFFIEVKGHVTDRNLVSALEEVKRLAKFYRVLGSYQAP
jgi:chorismate mutase/prephenate dehydratase